MEKKLPTFKLVIDENPDSPQEVSAVALVDNPAIGEGFFAFKAEFVEPREGEDQDSFMQRCIPYMIEEGKDESQAAAICSSIWDSQKFVKFAVTDPDKRIVAGPAMIPEMLIYRVDPDGTEYNVTFDAKTIEAIAEKFFVKGFQRNGNEMHDPSKPVDLVFFQSWIADKSKGVPHMAQFENLPDGTWYMAAKIYDDETWAKVKDGTFRGFSVEGLFDMKPIKMQAQPNNVLEQIKALLADI